MRVFFRNMVHLAPPLSSARVAAARRPTAWSWRKRCVKYRATLYSSTMPPLPRNWQVTPARWLWSITFTRLFALASGNFWGPRRIFCHARSTESCGNLVPGATNFTRRLTIRGGLIVSYTWCLTWVTTACMCSSMSGRPPDASRRKPLSCCLPCSTKAFLVWRRCT